MPALNTGLQVPGLQGLPNAAEETSALARLQLDLLHHVSVKVTTKTTRKHNIQVLLFFFFCFTTKKVPVIFYNPIKKTTTVRYKIKYAKTTRCYPAKNKA